MLELSPRNALKWISFQGRHRALDDLLLPVDRLLRPDPRGVHHRQLQRPLDRYRQVHCQRENIKC